MLGLTAIALIAGLVFEQVNLSPLPAYAVGAGVGFALSLKLLVDAIREKAFGSDVLALISITATALTNEWLAASVISLMLASGRALENWAAGRARLQLRALLERAPHQAHVIDSSGNLQDLRLSEVAVGTRILVRSGEIVPLDAEVLAESSFDESALTGEPLPKSYSANSLINSGVVNAGQSVEMVTTQTEQNSTYSALIRLVASAQADSANGVRVANKWAVRFVPFAMALAGGTWLITGELDRAVAVIVAATPCPLILAVPVAIIAGMSKAAGHGAVIKGGAALEQLARVKTILLDKTGTLTHGGPAISRIDVTEQFSADEVLRLAASLEQSSPHVVAKAIVAEAQDRDLALEIATGVTEQHGHGVTGMVGERKVSVGQISEAPDWVNTECDLLVGVTVDESLVGVIGLDDPIRADAIATVTQLRKLGLNRIVLVSGDREDAVAKVAQEVGADEHFAQCQPKDKLKIVRAEMQSTIGTVVAVGDGINDAPALAAAHVGVAMGARGATAASEAADVVIVEDSIRQLGLAIDIAQGARNRALQAAGVGMSCAMVAMVAASLGLLSATGAAISQEAIDAAAILWALVPHRIRKN
ncbi:MAG: hypothetical protein RIR16_168 [Actinomycetota bacterium]